MSVLDIVCLAIIAFAAIRCAFRGFIKEIMSMAALILGIVGALFFSKAGAIVVDTYIGYSKWNQIIAFLILFIVVYLIVKLLEGVLHRVFEKIKLDRLDHALGLFLGFLEGSLLVILVVYLIRVQPVFDATSLLEGSFVARIALEIVPVLVPVGGTAPAAPSPSDV